MTVCATCTTVEELLVRVARQIGDYSDEDPSCRFVHWGKGALLDFYNEAVQQLMANRPDAMATTVEFELQPGSLQKIPAGYTGNAKIEVNADASGAEGSAITPADEYFAKVVKGKVCRAPSCAADSSSYSVKNYSISQFSKTEFTVSPPVPPGQSPKVRAVLLQAASKICPTDTGKCVQFDPVYSGAITEWMLWRVWGGDAEVNGGVNQATMHLRAFFQMLGIQLTREMQYYAGGFRPSQSPPVRATQ